MQRNSNARTAGFRNPDLAGNCRQPCSGLSSVTEPADALCPQNQTDISRIETSDASRLKGGYIGITEAVGSLGSSRISVGWIIRT